MSKADADLERSLSPMRPQPEEAPATSANLLRFRARSSSREDRALRVERPRDSAPPEDYWAERSRLGRVDFGDSSHFTKQATQTCVAADLLQAGRDADRLFRIPHEDVLPPSRMKSQYPQLTSAFRPGGALQHLDEGTEEPASLSTQRMPFVHNRFFQDEFQGSKKRASQLGEEVPDEHEAGDRIYQYNHDDSPSRFTYERYSSAQLDPLNIAPHGFSNERTLLERSNVSLDSDRHQAASISNKIIRVRREGLDSQPAGLLAAEDKPSGVSKQH